VSSGALSVRDILTDLVNFIDMNLTLKISMACVLRLGEYDLYSDILTKYTVLGM
jgi:hypothetical protein